MFWIPIILILSTAVAIYYWPQIKEFLVQSLLPVLREHCSPEIVEEVENIVIWLDNGMSATRQKCRHVIEGFKRQILGMSTEIHQISSTEAEKKTTAFVRTEDGSVLRTVSTEKVLWEDLSPEMREEMIRQRTRVASTNDKEVILSKLEKLEMEVSQ